MTFLKATKTGFRKYFVMSGRASRSEYWWFMLTLCVILPVVVALLDENLFDAPDGEGPISITYSIFAIIPLFTAAVRRLHDTGRSAWFMFGVYLLPIACAMLGGFIAVAIGAGTDTHPYASSLIGFVAGFVVGIAIPIRWLVQKSEPGPNRYGPNPHEATP